MIPISVFLPVYNEEEILVENTGRLIQYLGTLNTPYEIIIVSNGSTDRTVELGRALASRCGQVKFDHIPDKAPGLALRRGVELASYEYIVTADMDLSVSPDFIKKAAELLTLGYDLVVGSKRMGNQKRSVLRKVASTAFIMTSMLLLGLSFDDYSIGGKAYRKALLQECEALLEGGTFYVIEVLHYASRMNRGVVEVPVWCDDQRRSRFNLLHEGLYRFGRLFLLWLQNSLGRR